MELGALTKTFRINSCYNLYWRRENSSTSIVTTDGRSLAWSFRPSATYIGKGIFTINLIAPKLIMLMTLGGDCIGCLI